MTGNVESPRDTPVASPTKVPVEWLDLDRQNPRLTGIVEETGEADVIAALYRSEDLSELLESIASNGYLDIEPLIVLLNQDRLIVVEGNRRLAAVRLFRDLNLVDRVSATGGVRINVPSFPEKFLPTLTCVSVYRVDTREDAWPFIGFKHINGAAKWKSYAKAKFAADWYKQGNVNLANIASRIGDRHDTVKRMVNAIYVLEQAKENDIFSMEDLWGHRFNFSHLYTALSRSAYMQFLGIKSTWASLDPSPNPVDLDNLERLEEILKWIYGSKMDNVPPVVQSQNPHIKQLGEVLLNQEALAVLRSEGSLLEAHLSIQPAGRKFSVALVSARREIRVVSNNLRGFDGQNGGLVDIAEDISETAQMIHGRMKKKFQDSKTGRE